MHSTIRFIIRLAFIALIVKIPAGIFGTALVQSLGLTDPAFSADAQSPVLTFDELILAIIIAPIIETIIGQLMPIELLRKVTNHAPTLILTSAAVFMTMHYPVYEFFPSAFAVGCVLSYAWLKQRDKGWRHAFWVVTAIHSLHNAGVALIAVFV